MAYYPGHTTTTTTTTYSNHQVNGWYGRYYQQIANNQMMMQQLQQWFYSVDLDRSGSITANELANVTFNGAPLGYEVAAKLVKVFDKDQNRSIDFYEYATLHQFLQVLQNAFFAADMDRSGTIDCREIFTALQQAGFNMLSFQTIQFDPYGRGLNFHQFVLLGCHIAHIKSIFEWNDPQRRGVVQFNFDQLCHVGTDILLKNQF